MSEKSKSDKLYERGKELAKMPRSPESYKKAGETRRRRTAERVMLSEVYGRFLAHEHDIISRDGMKKKLTGEQLISSVVSKVLARGDSASVSLLKEIREATEGNKSYVGGIADAPPAKIIIVGVDPDEDGI